MSAFDLLKVLDGIYERNMVIKAQLSNIYYTILISNQQVFTDQNKFYIKDEIIKATKPSFKVQMQSHFHACSK